MAAQRSPLSRAHHDILIALQGNACAICGLPETRKTPAGKPHRLAVDHCHATGKIRELLCSRCNTSVLGVVNDSAKTLRAAAAYLRRHARTAAKLPTITQMALPFDAHPVVHEDGVKFAGPSEFSWNPADVEARDDQIAQWREQGVTHKEIARRLGCTRQRVGQLLERIQERRPLNVARTAWRTCWCGRAIPAETRRTYCSPGHNPSSLAVGRNMLTQAQYDALRSAQGGVCAICKMTETRTVQGKPKMLSVDHCHATGTVRQLLCSRCNLLLGTVNDDPKLLTAAASYLAKHRTAESPRAASSQKK